MILEDFQLVLNDGDKAVIIGEEETENRHCLKWMYDPALTEDYIESTGERIIGKERLGYLPQELPEAEKRRRCMSISMIKKSSGIRQRRIWRCWQRKFGLTEEIFFLSASADE